MKAKKLASPIFSSAQPLPSCPVTPPSQKLAEFRPPGAPVQRPAACASGIAIASFCRGLATGDAQKHKAAHAQRTQRPHAPAQSTRARKAPAHNATHVRARAATQRNARARRTRARHPGTRHSATRQACNAHARSPKYRSGICQAKKKKNHQYFVVENQRISGYHDEILRKFRIPGTPEPTLRQKRAILQVFKAQTAFPFRRLKTLCKKQRHQEQQIS